MRQFDWRLTWLHELPSSSFIFGRMQKKTTPVCSWAQGG